MISNRIRFFGCVSLKGLTHFFYSQKKNGCSLRTAVCHLQEPGSTNQICIYLIFADDFAIVDQSQVLIGFRADIFTQKADASITEQEVATADVCTAGGTIGCACIVDQEVAVRGRSQTIVRTGSAGTDPDTTIGGSLGGPFSGEKRVAGTVGKITETVSPPVIGPSPSQSVPTTAR